MGNQINAADHFVLSEDCYRDVPSIPTILKNISNMFHKYFVT